MYLDVAGLILLVVIFNLGLGLIGYTSLKWISFERVQGLQRVTVSYWLGYIVYAWLMMIPMLFNIFTLKTVLLPFVLVIPAIYDLISYKVKSVSLWRYEKGHLWGIIPFLIIFMCFPYFLFPVADYAQEPLFALSEFSTQGMLMSSAYVIPAAVFKIGGMPIYFAQKLFMAFAVLMAVYTLGRIKVRTSTSWLLSTFILLTPAVFYGIYTGQTFVHALVCISLALYSLIYFTRSEQPRWLLLAAVFTGGALSAGPVGLPSTFALLVLTVIIAMRQQGTVKKVFSYIITTLAIGSHWYIFSLIELQNDFLPSLQQLLQQSDDALLMGTIGLGPLFIMSIVPSVLLLLARFPRKAGEYVGVTELITLTFLVFCVFYSLLGMNSIMSDAIVWLPAIALPALMWGQHVMARSNDFVRWCILALFAVIFIVFVALIGAIYQPSYGKINYIHLKPENVLVAPTNTQSNAQLVPMSKIKGKRAVDVLNRLLEQNATHIATDDSVISHNIIQKLESYGCLEHVYTQGDLQLYQLVDRCGAKNQ